jgi:type VI secretion system protein ImpJ
MLAKVGSGTQIEDLIRQALSSLPLVHMPVPPRAIPVRLDYQYFSIESRGLMWESVTRARNMAVYAPGELGDLQMELIILPQ